MPVVELVKIGFSTARQYFSSVGNFYNDGEVVKIQPQMLQPSAPKPVSISWIEYIFLPITMPFYNMLYMGVKALVLNAPSWMGGYQGIDTIDVCSSLTGISTKHLVSLPDVCQERLEQKIHGYSVVVIAILVIILFYYLAPITRYVHDKWCEEKQRQREHEQLMIGKKIAAINLLTKRPSISYSNGKRINFRIQKGGGRANAKWKKEHNAAALAILGDCT